MSFTHTWGFAMTNKRLSHLMLVSIAAMTAAGCATQMMVAPQAPDAIKVPAGHAYRMTLVGAGDLTYECRATATGAAWTFAGPNATLTNAAGTVVGKYYGGPTWEANDGSKVVGKQLATAPATRPGAIPLQLVEITSGMGTGAMAGTTYIQRLDTTGGVAPGSACDTGRVGAKETVQYRADYAFYGKS
jgi:Protein of unknown function (DUF3455)